MITFEQILETKLNLYLDGGQCKIGLESTILDLTGTNYGSKTRVAITIEKITKGT